MSSLLDSNNILDSTDIAAVRELMSSASISGEVTELLAQTAELEQLSRSIQARLAAVAVALSNQMTAVDLAQGIPRERAGAGAATSIALARRLSPHRGRVLLSMARVAHEMPHTQRAFIGGLVDQDRMIDMLRETACLTLPDRELIDSELAADSESFARMSTRELIGRARSRAGELDPAAMADRRRRAENERRVWIRPAPDTMIHLTALLPMADGVGVFASLKAAAAASEGPQGQAMADTLVARVTGRAAGDQPVAVQLMITDTSLLTGTEETAHINGFGPIPADLARELVSSSLSSAHLTTLRRVYTHPATGQLVTMESRSRTFPKALAEFIAMRDQRCRTAGCNAPIAHIDHIHPWSRGGPTSAVNGQGLCAQCNLAKEQTLSRMPTAPPALGRTG